MGDEKQKQQQQPIMDAMFNEAELCLDTLSSLVGRTCNASFKMQDNRSPEKSVSSDKDEPAPHDMVSKMKSLVERIHYNNNRLDGAVNNMECVI